jgi:LysR family transcriptional regulator for bpeEF and oprC
MEQSDLDLNLLESFVKVVEAGSFTKAAARLKQPKSRVSRHISKLESDLGVQLIYRTTRQFQLTEAGRTLFEQCKVHMDGLETAVSCISQHSEDISGTIRVTAPEDLSVAVLSGIADEFLDLYPKVRLDFMITNTVIDLIKESVDVALRVGHPRDSTMLIKKVGTLQSQLVASPKLLSKYSSPPRIDTLANFPTISFSLDQNKWQLKSARQSRTIKINPIIRCSNFFMVRRFALSGRGIALMPSFLATEALATGTLVQVLPEWKSDLVPLQLLMPPQKNVPRRVRLFVDYIAQKLTL